MKQAALQDRWFVVKQLLLLTEKEVKHLSITSNRIKALEPNIYWIETLENNIEYSEMLDAFVARSSRLTQDDINTLLLKSQYNPINHLDAKLDEVTADVASLKGEFNSLKGKFEVLKVSIEHTIQKSLNKKIC